MKSHFNFLNLLFVGVFLLISCQDKDDDDKQQTGEKDLYAYNQMEPYFDADWAKHQLWDDGLAEVATYEAERVVYKKNRQFEFTMITVKEDFNLEYDVKTDNYERPDLLPVFKINQFYHLQTDKYPYHYLTSIFVKRHQPYTVHKLTSSSQEWCGNTFKAFTDEGKYYEFEYDSYFDGQGEGKKQVQKDVLFEDQLPFSLRSLNFKPDLKFQAAVLETQQTNQAKEPVVYQAQFSVSQGDFNDSLKAWIVTVKLDNQKTNQYWIGARHPNPLLKQSTWDGRNLTLKNLQRNAYWQAE